MEMIPPLVALYKIRSFLLTFKSYTIDSQPP